jgi:hypothetical protein
MIKRHAVPVDLSFKGDRHYLHGTDVYEAAVSSLRSRWPDIDGRCRFMFHRVTSRPLAAVCESFSKVAPRPEDCIAEMHVTGRQDQASVWFVEREGQVTGRYPYDEDRVVADCAVTENRIAIGGLPQARPIEITVAMTKRLHYSMLKPATGRWLFTRLDLDRLLQPRDLAGLTITLAMPVRSAITRSVIGCQSGSLGSIYFSVGQT